MKEIECEKCSPWLYPLQTPIRTGLSPSPRHDTRCKGEPHVLGAEGSAVISSKHPTLCPRIALDPQPITSTSSSGDSRHPKAMQSKDSPMPPAKIFQWLIALCYQKIISSLILSTISLLCPQLPAVSLCPVQGIPRRGGLIFLGPGSAEFSFVTRKGPAWWVQ